LEYTKREEDMLAGEYGSGPQKSMELLSAVGKVYNAKNMIPVASSHLVIPEIQLFPKGKEAEWGMEITRKLLTGVEKFSVPATINPTVLDLDKWQALEISAKFVEEMKPIFKQSMAFYEAKGAIPNYSCAPFFDFFYRKGEHLGGAESVQVLYNNSVNGSRLNRETGPTALAVAVTGVTPNYGMHHDENRKGQVLFELDSSLDPRSFSDADYNALGYFGGRMAVERIPVFNGLSPRMSETDLKYLCVPLAVTAGIPMIHVAGVTPEAPTLEAAFGGEKPEEVFHVSKKELASSYDRLNTATSDDIDYVALGCPHCSIRELRKIADLLKGNKVHTNVVLFIATSTVKYALAERMGWVKEIESSGAVVVKGMCPGASIFGRFGKELGVKNVATNSSKNAHYIGAHSGGSVKTHFGSSQQCIESAIAGKWRG
jgi:phosphomecalonate degydratase large subunit